RVFSHSLSMSISFFFYVYLDHRDLHSFPTRRSSDLRNCYPNLLCRNHLPKYSMGSNVASRCFLSGSRHSRRLTSDYYDYFIDWRSEEHTSELQSRFDLVCRLLLEKKKRSYNMLIIQP